VDIPVEKKWADGASGEQAVIVLVKNGEETDQTLTLTENNSWKGTFENLPKYDDDGNEISYTVTEKTSNYYYSVKSDGNGGYVVTNSPSTETVDIPVEKKWADGASGEEAVIVLVKNGEETDQTLTLTENNSWKGSFTNLPKYDANGKLISYTVDEKTDSYNYTVTSDGNGGYVVTNYPMNPFVPKTPGNSTTYRRRITSTATTAGSSSQVASLPKTGDTSNAVLYGVLAMLGLMGVIILIRRRRRSN
jgi:LPXTG-motif cell wall-anchored protein